MQNRILSAFQYALKPGGFLFLGKSEAISAYSDIFAAEDRTHKIFSRKPKVGHGSSFRLADRRPQEPGLAPAKIVAPALPVDFQKQAEQVLLQRYAPPALVIDSDLRVLHFQGDAGAYLVLSTGPPTVHLLKMLRPEFLVDLRTRGLQGQEKGTAAATQPIRIRARRPTGSRAPGSIAG